MVISVITALLCIGGLALVTYLDVKGLTLPVDQINYHHNGMRMPLLLWQAQALFVGLLLVAVLKFFLLKTCPRSLFFPAVSPAITNQNTEKPC